MRILITAGPTREFIDPVRYISNSSTGYFGYKIAEEALKRGHKVTLVSGPVQLDPPKGAVFVPVVSALEMERAVKRRFRGSDCLIMSAAVADYRPERFSPSKIKKKNSSLSLRLRRNPDILSWAGNLKGGGMVIGFALETDNIRKNALAKLKRKKADLLVAVSAKGGSGPFGNKKIKVVCFDAAGGAESVFSTKGKIASFILDKAENG